MWSCAMVLPHHNYMKITKIVALGIAVSCSACVNSGGTNSDESVDLNTDNRFSSQLSLIEDAFQKGDSKTACNLQLKLSKDFASLDNISSEYIQTFKKFQTKCMQSLSNDFKNLLNE